MQRIISLIVATAKKRVIGKDNDMPWGRLPIDLKHFKDVTSGNPVIMGRKTYESIGRPLPKRRNIVLTKQDIKIEGCEVVHSLDEALKLTENESEVFIIGGGYLYSEAINIADKLYLTLIDLDIEGDTFFPEYNLDDYYEIDCIKNKKDDKNKYDTVFLELEKKQITF